MKKITMILGLFLALASCKNNQPAEEATATTPETATTAPTGAAEEMTLDATTSHLTWLGKKVAGQHNGKVSLKEGKASFSGNTIVSASPIVVDLNTIVCDDITEKEMNAKLIGHLKAADFFDVAKYPTATFETTSVEGGNTLVGKLTIKDKTEEVKIPVTVVNENGTAKVSGKVTIDRTKFGVMYSSGKLAETLKDKIINDEVEMGLELTFKK